MNKKVSIRTAFSVVSLTLILLSSALACACTGAKVYQTAGPNTPAPEAGAFSQESPAPLLCEPDPSCAYTLTVYSTGEAVNRVNIPADSDDAKAIEGAVMDALVRSAAWPMDDLPPLKDYFEIVQRFDGEVSTHLVFLSEDGSPCISAFSGMWTFLSVDSYDAVAGAADAPLFQTPGPIETDLTAAMGGASFEDEQQALSEAIKAALCSRVSAGDIQAEAHETIWRAEQGQSVSFGLLCMYAQFGSKDWASAPALIKVRGTGPVPIKITLERDDGGLYRAVSVQFPRSGSLYEPTLREMFPPDCLDAALNIEMDTEQKLINSLLDSASEWAADSGFSNTMINFDYYYANDGVFLANAAAARALALVGSPYEAGAQGPESFDPSGLIAFILREQGVTLSKKSCAVLSEQSEWARIEDISRIKPGDILFFTDGSETIEHAGLYAGEGRFVHASLSSGAVIASPLGEGPDSSWYSSFSHALRWWE